MRFPIRGARHRRRPGRRIAVAATVLALLGGGTIAATSFANEDQGRPKLVLPAGTTMVDTEEPTASTYLVGGSDTSISEAPFMVQLFFDFDHAGETYSFTCGGTLVAPNKVLTAAHCMYDNGVRQDWAAYGAVLAGTDKLAGGPDNSAGHFIDVVRSYVRGGYDDDNIQHDAAVLTLAKPVPGASTLAMANTEDSRLYATDTPAVTYGWGLTTSEKDGTARLASTLQKVSMPLHTDAECASVFDPVLGAGMYKPGDMLCAGLPGTGDDATGEATCPGDSGGPLVKSGHVIGITSWGVSTGSQYCNVEGTVDAFTKVATHERSIRPRVDDTDLNRNGRADLYLRYKDGTGYQKLSTGTGFAARTKLAGSWSAYNITLQTDLNRDGYQDFILRRSSDGAVYWRHRTASSPTWIDTRVATGWATRKFVAAPGDITGDRYPDLLSVASDGTLYVYPGKGNGTFAARVTAGSGYQGYNSFRGHGDLTVDGKADVLARRSSDGAMVLLRGTGKAAAPFAAPVKVRSWPTYTGFAAPGDVTGDGIADFVTRGGTGNLYLYAGTGKATSEIFAPAIKIGTGYQDYGQLG
ncbi:trypsin-like serine protease [Streptomyces polyrhachis]|uniref:Trypsin-like serine protease n=1 Tax=Streptomyces polyrhachis TaxID=1282885 RepID=A0ABW2GM14_9ACTN